MKTTKKRVLSFVVATTMVFGIFPMNVYAAENGYAPQIVEPGSDPVRLVKEAGNPKTLEENRIAMDKSIKQTGEDTFEITLKVATTEEVEQTFSSPDAAVVVVMDYSGSMAEKVSSSTSTTRIVAARDAAKTFVDNFVKDNMGASRKISLVTFNESAKTALSWTEANTAQGVTTVKTAIDKLTSPTSGTNMEGGMRLANNLLGMGDVSALDHLFVVLLTDGVPTWYVADNSKELNSTTSMSGTRGGGNEATSADYKDIPGIATAIKAKANNNAKLYTINFGATGTVNKLDINTWLAGFANQNVNASNVTQLTQAFETIANNIVKQMQAWLVKDPMGEFIVFDKVKNSSLSVNYDTTNNGVLTFDEGKNELTWDLKQETVRVSKENDVTTYTLSYNIKLDTSHPDFREDTSYDTNGITSLTYVFATITGGQTVLGDIKTTEFIVPKVQGTIPSYNYGVEYYKKAQGESDYPKTPTATWNSKAPAKLHSTVKISDIDPEYLSKYGDDYSFTSGSTEQVIVKGDNVIKLYYDPIPADVIVNHYVKYITIAENGQQSVKDYPAEPTEVAKKSAWKGFEYTITPLSEKDGNGVEKYVLDTNKSDAVETITLPSGTTVKKLYYTHTTDLSKKASLTVNHKYELTTWVLNNEGKFVEKVETFDGTPDIIAAGLFAGNKQALTVKDGKVEEGKDVDFKVDSVTPDATLADGKYQVDLKEGPNEYTINYKGTLDNRQQVDVTVEHYYREITVANENPEWTKEPGEPVPAYVGETFTATPVPNGYERKTSDDNLTITVQPKVQPTDNVIQIYYEKDSRVATTVTVNHVYTTKTFETITVPVMGERDVLDDEGQLIGTESYDTGVVTTEVVESTQSGASDPVTLTGFYVGQSYGPVVEQTSFEGNLYKYKDGDKSIASLGAGSNTITLYYEREVTVDDRSAADLTVTHEYRAYKTYVNGKGEIVYGELDKDNSYTVSEADDVYTGQAGDEVTVTVKNETGYTRTDKNEVTVNLNGSKTMTLVYEANEVDDQRGGNVSVRVKPVYVTYTTQINDETGKLEIVESQDDSAIATEYSDMYAEQFFSANIPAFAKKGFVFSPKLTTDPYKNVRLGASNDDITLYYVTSAQNLQPTTVTVYHHYKFVTKTVKNGVYTETTTIDKTVPVAVPAFVGQNFTAVQLPSIIPGMKMPYKEADRDLSFRVVQGTNVINLYYYGEKDMTKEATITVNHHYKQIDLNGTITEVTNPLESQGKPASSYVGVSFTATEDLLGTEGIENPYRRVTPATLEDLTVTLVEGDNVIDIYYERTIDTREATAVHVTHKYFAYDTRIDPTKANRISEGTFEQTFDTVDAGAWIGNTFTAALRAQTGEGAAVVRYALDPADQVYSIEVTKDGDNTIVIEYSRDFASPLPPTPPGGGGTGGGGGGGGGGTGGGGGGTTPGITIPDDNVPLGDVPQEVKQPPVIIREDEVPLSDAPEMEILDDDVPLGEAPEELEIPEDDVPLGDVPNTGDPNAAMGYGLLGMLSFGGLALLKAKKEQEEDEA